MKLAVTIVSPRGYQHSEAFREVAESVHLALQALGHDSVLTTELQLPGRRHIVFGAHLLDGQALGDHAIVYNLEQILPGSPWLTAHHLDVLRLHEVWDYSQANLTALQKLGVCNARLVPVGSVPQLTRIAEQVEDLDVLFIGSLNPRRLKVLHALRAKGLKVHVANGVYGAARDALIARARIQLNLHYYESRVFEVVRVSYLLANRRCVVSERGVDEGEEQQFAEGVAFAEYDQLVETCVRLLQQPDERQRLKRAGFEVMAARPATASLERALANAA